MFVHEHPEEESTFQGRGETVPGEGPAEAERQRPRGGGGKPVQAEIFSSARSMGEGRVTEGSAGQRPVRGSE